MSGMLDVPQQMDKPQDYRDKVFVGKVVVTDDPRRFHRIKVEIPDMWDGYKQEELPWCIPAVLAGGCGPSEYSQDIPDTGNFVYVTFQNGDDHFPMYWGGVRDYRTMQTVLHQNYPHRVGRVFNSYVEVDTGTERKRKFDHKDPPAPVPVTGHHMFLDRSTNDVEYEHPTKTRIHIFPNGSVRLEVRDKRWPDGGDLVIDTDRDMRVNVGLATNPGRPGDMYVDVVEGKLAVHVKTTATIHVEGDVTLNADAKVTATVGGDLAVTVGGKTDVSSTGPIAINTPSTFTVNSDKFKIDASGNVTSPGTIRDGDHVDTA